MPISLAIVDPHGLVRDGIRRFLELQHPREFVIVCESADGQSTLDGKPLVKQLVKLQPDVVMMEAVQPSSSFDGLGLLKELLGDRDTAAKWPDAQVMMLSGYDNPSYVARSSILRALDYVLKSEEMPNIVSAIRRVAAGDPAPDASLFARILRSLGRPDAKMEGVPVTRRELQILRHVAYGMSNKDIARSCGISIETVKEHVQNILRKLDVADRTAAAVWAVKQRVV